MFMTSAGEALGHPDGARYTEFLRPLLGRGRRGEEIGSGGRVAVRTAFGRREAVEG